MTAEQIRGTINDFSIGFISILYEALPFIILGAIIAGILEEYLPQKLITRVLPKKRFFAIMLGGVLGLIFPMCECGIIPVMRRLLRKGLPLSCCIAYLLAGPIINVIVMLSTYVAFTRPDQADPSEALLTSVREAEVRSDLGMFQGGLTVIMNREESSSGDTLNPTPRGVANMVGLASGPGVGPVAASPALLVEAPSDGEKAEAAFQLNALWMMILRVAMGYIIAITTAVIVDRQFQKHGTKLLTPLATPDMASEKAETIAEKKQPFFKRLSNVSETALHDFIDITVFLILGALLAATVSMFLTHEQIEQLSTQRPILAILFMMLLAVILCLCSEADAFVAASFTKLVPAAKLSFLVLGPMFDLKLYLMYTRIFRPRLIWTIIFSVVIQVALYSYILHLLWQWQTPTWMGYYPGQP